MAATENIILFISSSWRFSNNLFIQHKSDWAKTITINFFFEHTMVNHVLHNEKWNFIFTTLCHGSTLLNVDHEIIVFFCFHFSLYAVCKGS